MTTDWLRPMSLGELLDRTFSLYRHHFLLLVGIMAPQAVFVAAISPTINSVLASQRAGTGVPATAPDPAAMLSLFAIALPAILLFAVISLIGGSIVHGAATTAVSRIYLGKPVGVVDSFSRLKGRIGRLILVSLGVTLRLLGFAFVLALGLVIVIAIGAGIHSSLGIAFAIVAGCIALVVYVRFVLGYMVASSVLIVEDSGSGEAIARSVRLMAGQRLRAGAIVVLMVVISYAALMLLQGPFIVLTAIAKTQHVEPSGWVPAGMAIGQAVSTCLTGPLTLVALVLLYFDIRIRKEAFDLALLAAGAAEEEQALKPPLIPAPGGPDL